jgi:hypothetical protein
MDSSNKEPTQMPAKPKNIEREGASNKHTMAVFWVIIKAVSEPTNR